MKKLILSTIVLFSAAFSATAQAEVKTLPLDAKNWVSLPYSKIPANAVNSNDKGLKVKVAKSAGPLVHKLDKAVKVTSIKVKALWTGSKKPEEGKFDEDSILRVGLVATGDQTLTGPKRWFAAKWVKELFKLAPKGEGLDKIYFFNVTNRKDLLYKARKHPSTDLIHEKIVHVSEQAGEFEFTYTLEKPIETAALWLSIDGDDTDSEYELKIKEIQLAPVGPELK